MPIPLLVVTTDQALGEHLRECLEERGRFSVRITGDQATAVACVQELNCSLAFLDAGTEEQAMLEIGQALRLVSPEMRFIVVSEVGWHSKLEKLFPLYYLSKPFDRNDLLKMLDSFFPASPSGAGPAPTSRARVVNELPWLTDVTRAAQHLTRLTLESSAQAALITRTNRLWAYAGQLPQSAASELADIVARYWDRKEQHDLVRFVRMTSTNAEHMLYATRLAEGMVLALVFDAETPFSKIRSQASQLVRSLSAKPSEAETVEGEEDVGPEIHISTFSTLLSDVPPPNPSGGTSADAAQTGRKSETGGSHPPADSGNPPRDTLSLAPFAPLIDTDQAEQEPDETQVGARQSKRQKRGSAEDELTETRPAHVMGRRIILEPVSPSVYNLCYACVLIPRFPEHYLTGDLSDRLSEWIPQICIAFGWRLEYISIRPEYLQGIVNVPPATSPGYLMRILRQHISEKIFTDFPRFKKENPSGDFWAPGFLIMGGSQPAPAQLIKDFIGQTRQRQGIT